MLPSVHSKVWFTKNGTPYLKEPGIAVISVPHVDLSGTRGFLEGFNPELEFLDYLSDEEIPDCERLIKFAGQICYYSFNKKRSKNKDAQKYLDHIKESSHGSIAEHAKISMLVYGIDRSLTAELCRHRTGIAISQVSQRYCNNDTLRFVERPEFQKIDELHVLFEERIDRVAYEYENLAKKLATVQGSNLDVLYGDSKTEMRKKVNQAARALLTNETEAPMVLSFNLRSARHFIEMRANKAADLPIRYLAVKMSRCLKQIAPMIFSDHHETELPDGSIAIESKWRKI